MDLPVPVERAVHLLPQRCRVQQQVVGRPVESRQRPEDVAKGFCGRHELRIRGAPEIRVVPAGHDPHLER